MMLTSCLTTASVRLHQDRAHPSRPFVSAAALLLVVSFLAPGPVHAEWDVDGLEELLPRRETEAERMRWRGREDEMPQRLGAADPPPVMPIRNCAEWEPTTGVIVRYPLGLPYSLLRDMDDDVILHVVVSNSDFPVAQSNLNANGVDMSQVEWLVKPNDSIWSRDWGPWFVFDGNDQLSVIDHVYNRPWRPNDNLLPIEFANQQGLTVYSHDMWHTGGNYMTDGAHISSSTELVYIEASAQNGLSPAQVDALMADYYGIDTYSVLPYIESGGIHHIDTWAKFLDEETVLLKEVWTSHHTYPTLEQRATLLASLPSSTGRNYDVHRVYCYDIGGNDPASYTNSLILNETVYVPLFGNSTWDDNALAAYEAAMPGYDVRGYFYGGWLTDDALHCRAKGVMDVGMLRVEHVPVRDPQNGAVEIEAAVVPHSGAALTSVELTYRRNGGSWTTSSMSASGGQTFAATIPAPAVAGTTEYYVLAADASGREEGMPRSAPSGWYAFEQSPPAADADPRPGAELGVAHSSFPNPFRSTTTIRFELRYPEPVELSVFDAQGRRVRTLLDGEARAGVNEIRWDGRDGHGRTVAAGRYFVRLRAAGLEYRRGVTRIE